MLKEISIEIIRKCPNHCLHCSSLSSPQCTEKMSLPKFREIVIDAKKLGVATVCLSGGEPFLHNEIREFVSFVHASGLNCYIYTSGITFNESGMATSVSPGIMEQLSDYVTKIIFNIEAGTEETYDEIMGTHGFFDLMQQSARNAADAGICTEAHFVPMKLNVHEIEDVISLCKAIRISKISFLRLVIHGRALQNRALIALSDQAFGDFRTKLLQLQEEGTIPIRIGVPLARDSLCSKCEAANGKLNIKYDGTVYPCEVFKNITMEHSLGAVLPESIYEHSLEEIYYHSEFLNRVRSFANDFSVCTSCETCIGQYMIQKEVEKQHGQS